jgi:hypothetical protein
MIAGGLIFDASDSIEQKLMVWPKADSNGDLPGGGRNTSSKSRAGRSGKHCEQRTRRRTIAVKGTLVSDCQELSPLDEATGRLAEEKGDVGEVDVLAELGMVRVI